MRAGAATRGPEGVKAARGRCLEQGRGQGARGPVHGDAGGWNVGWWTVERRGSPVRQAKRKGRLRPGAWGEEDCGLAPQVSSVRSQGRDSRAVLDRVSPRRRRRWVRR